MVVALGTSFFSDHAVFVCLCAHLCDGGAPARRALDAVPRAAQAPDCPAYPDQHPLSLFLC